MYTLSIFFQNLYCIKNILQLQPCNEIGSYLIFQNYLHQLQRSLSNLIEATKNGVTLKGKRYKTFLADGRRGLMAKGEERSGCSACQTRTLVLVAVHDHTGKPSRCNEEVMRLGDFFWAKGL